MEMKGPEPESKEAEKEPSRIQIGSKVALRVIGRVLQYEMVAPQDANPLGGKLSSESQLGLKIMGHITGEKITVETAGDKLEYTILQVK